MLADKCEVPHVHNKHKKEQAIVQIMAARLRSME
ncbi:unnamed protein product [Musa banksii]